LFLGHALIRWNTRNNLLILYMIRSL
jgi:hypothetical protein